MHLQIGHLGFFVEIKIQWEWTHWLMQKPNNVDESGHPYLTLDMLKNLFERIHQRF